MKKKNHQTSPFPFILFVFLFLGLFTFLYQRATKSALIYQRTYGSPLPSPSSTKQTSVLQSSSDPSPLPTSITLNFSPLSSSGLSWVEDNNHNGDTVAQIFDYDHTSYTKWRAEQFQASGQADSYKYFHDSIYAFYKQELEKIGWVSDVTADGVSGAVRAFKGVKNNQVREMVLYYDLTNETNECGSAGCFCPCNYSYTLYLSSIDPITD